MKITSKHKKVIAREGLIIIGFIVLAVIAMKIGNTMHIDWSKYRNSGLRPPTLSQEHYQDAVNGGFSHKDIVRLEQRRYKEQHPVIARFQNQDVTFFIIFFGYPVYLLIRFIIWAIKILKERG